MLRRKSQVESTWQAVGTGHGAILQTSASPGASCVRPLPSNDTQAWLLLLKGTTTRRVTCSGSISGRKDREWGQIGVKRIPGTYCHRYKVVVKIKDHEGRLRTESSSSSSGVHREIAGGVHLAGCGDGPWGHTADKRIPRRQLCPAFAIKRHPGVAPAVERHHHTESHVLWEYQWPKGQRVGADWREKDSRDLLS
ncbi:proline-tRNA ligase [Striga asiatica]|uniref:Proline-tRNA ligase n=1 Tax=Striga asiatica TaxID=4170 RepID=A0A5A7Q6A6_STRAF|nr:proline-tRNA ligase [Striga asiatica]